MSWSVLVRVENDRRRIALGKYPAMGLKEARRKADEAGEEAKSQPASMLDKRPLQVGTVRDLFSFVIDQMRKEKVATVGEYESYLINRADSALNVLGLDENGEDRPANQVTPDDVTRWLRGFHSAGALTGHPRAYLSAAFGRGLSADYDPTNPNPKIRFNLSANPVSHVGGKMKGAPRNRVLTLAEISDFWHGFDGRGVSSQMKLILRLIISMGGVRISEIVRCQKDWYPLRQGTRWISLPKTKNDHPHDLPLTGMAEAAFESALFISAKDSPFLFPKHHKPDEPQTLNSISQAVRKWCDRKEVERFQPRDLRRTFKTLLIERNPELNRDWIDVWHNHGRAADVARKHYDRAEYTKAKMAVAEAIDTLMRDLIFDTPSKQEAR
jgi:integrase